MVEMKDIAAVQIIVNHFIAVINRMCGGGTWLLLCFPTDFSPSLFFFFVSFVFEACATVLQV